MARIGGGDAINRRYLHEEVAERLRELVLSGELAPLSRINELALAERFGISRTPLREAIKVLANEGLVELLPQRGARVASLSLAEIDEMIEVVAALEGSAAELACQAFDISQLERLDALQSEIVAAWKASDEELYLRVNRDIHDLIMAASGNRTLQELYASLAGRIQRARYSAHKTPEQWRRAIDDHEEMLRLIRGGEAAALADLMRRHVRSKKTVIAAAFGATDDRQRSSR